MKPLYLHLEQSPQIVSTDRLATQAHKWINKLVWVHFAANRMFILDLDHPGLTLIICDFDQPQHLSPSRLQHYYIDHKQHWTSFIIECDIDQWSSLSNWNNKQCWWMLHSDMTESDFSMHCMIISATLIDFWKLCLPSPLHQLLWRK